MGRDFFLFEVFYVILKIIVPKQGMYDIIQICWYEN